MFWKLFKFDDSLPILVRKKMVQELTDEWDSFTTMASLLDYHVDKYGHLDDVMISFYKKDERGRLKEIRIEMDAHLVTRNLCIFKSIRIWDIFSKEEMINTNHRDILNSIREARSLL